LFNIQVSINPIFFRAEMNYHGEFEIKIVGHAVEPKVKGSGTKTLQRNSGRFLKFS